MSFFKLFVSEEAPYFLGSSIPYLSASSKITSLYSLFWIFTRNAKASPPAPHEKHLKIPREGLTDIEGFLSL